jgi:2-oxoglutarate ferredoxin oxidoreductase subunit alpha
MVMKNDISIVLCGEAGQGLQVVEKSLASILKTSGYNVFATKEVMSRVRGGVNSTSIRISPERVCAYVERIDLLVPLSPGRTKHLQKRISKETKIIGEKGHIDFACLEGSCQLFDISFSDLAAEAGSKIYANSVAIGALCALLAVDFEKIRSFLSKYFDAKGDKVVNDNLEAARKGYDTGIDLRESKKITLQISKGKDIEEQVVLSGAEALSLGAIAGGCNFISAYPMSPSTGVLVFLSQHAKEFGIVAEQAEDEICAINMGLGAWYAGARAIVSTSGGGFALMQEGMSLGGMIESPLVMHIAQRPGPATGLPTRTEQADLNLALYCGHGEFPRIILTPGNIEECFYLAQKAFDLADKYQIPVFILTDQFLMDSYYNFSTLNIDIKSNDYIAKTGPDYRRYAITENGISPRGIPGYGEGLVTVDSDEHDEEGHITEDLEIRTKMVDKRLKKMSAIKEVSIKPELIGLNEYKMLIIGWGSNYEVIKEALQQINKSDWAFLHFKQVFPLPPDSLDYLKRAEKIVCVENNASGQFAGLIKLETGIEIKERILKYNGLPFSVEEILEKLKNYG